MIIDALKPLLESGVINEATRDAINEAWESKLSEARNQLRAEIREEFADRYAHDKENMVEALDKMTSETLAEEVKKIREEQKLAVDNRVKTIKEMKAVSKKFSNFLIQKLTEEIREFRADRKKFQAASGKLENFVMKSLAEEITEFNEDKQDLARTKVKLVSEASAKLDQLKSKFVARSAKAVQETVEKVLKTELTQLHEDISAARKNHFGRKIYEAFYNEFATSYLSENKEMRAIKQELVKTQNNLAEAKKLIAGKNKVIESKEQKLQLIERGNERSKVINELLSPLAKEKQAVMSQLLESVQTSKLRVAYDKYLPSVLSNDSAKTNRLITENRVGVTGDKRSAKVVSEDKSDTDNIIDIKRLAGLDLAGLEK